MGVGGNGNVESHSRTSLVTTCHDEIAKCTCVTLGGKMARLARHIAGHCGYEMRASVRFA